MNMKKTIAAIAAGAVAVSAMATTTSALAAKTLTYNLVKTVKNDDAVGTITATFTNVPLQANGKVVIEAVGTSGATGPITDGDWGAFVMTISGSFWDDEAGVNKSFVPVVATRAAWETGYSIEGARITDGNIVTIPVVADKVVPTNTALKSSSSAVITVTLKYSDLPSSVGYAGDLNALIREGKRGIILKSLGDPSQSGEEPVQATYKIGGTTAVNIDVRDQAELNKLSGLTLTYQANKWEVTNVDGACKVAGVSLASGVTDPGQVTISAVPAGIDTNTYTIKLYSATQGLDQDGNDWTVSASANVLSTGDIITVSYTKPAIALGADVTSTVNKALTFVVPVAATDTLTMTEYKAPTSNDGVIWTSPLSGAAVETSGNGETKYPYHSTLQNSIYKNGIIGGSLASSSSDTGKDGSGDVISWIGYANSDSAIGVYDTKAYQISDAARSVINDAIQNYADIVFTFNTATSKVKDGKYSTDNDAVDYTAFGRHFWDRDTGYDTNTVYIYNDWIGNNLFEGALIINNNLTLSLGATDKFDWTATSLSFSWDAIQDTALTQNQYANYVQNMVLRTSTDWYWDNMTVTLGETETEEVDSGAPVEGNVEDLPEDEEEDFDIDLDEEEDEEPAPVVAEPEPEPEPAPAAAPNPGTGNAPVALAVIPVALAAAAIVAKKRG